MIALERMLLPLPAVSLDDLNSTSALLDRVDRKYLVSAPVLAGIIGDLPERPYALEINGLRSFRYDTDYYDTADFLFFRQHVQRRRHRFKVRTRSYLDSGASMLEVKSKGLRGLTVKQRRPHQRRPSTGLGDEGAEFVAAITGIRADRLQPVLRTLYRRSTLAYGDQRITLDSDLQFQAGVQQIIGPPEILVETKSPGGASQLDRMLLRAGIRPHSVSKYCLAASLLYPQLPGNDWLRVRRRYWPDAHVRASVARHAA